MRVRVWVFFCAGLGFMLAGLFLLEREFLIGFGIGGGTLAALAWRLRPGDYQGIAGGHVRSVAHIVYLRALGLVVAFLTACGFVAESAIEHWTRTREGFVAVLALIGLEVMLGMEIRRQIDDLFKWMRGADGEEEVEKEINRLRDEGWFVFHNYKPRTAGNVDHIAIGPRGAFAIETKSGRFRAADASQAVRSAMAVREALGGGWVTAVLCVPGDQKPVQKGHAWLVGRNHLVDWLRSEKSRPVAPQRIEALKSALALN